MADPSVALQVALYELLTSALTVPVHDSVPEDTPYPYVVIDSEISSNASPLSGKKRDDRLLYLSVWSDYQGQSEVKRINAEIAQALDGIKLPLSAGRVVAIRVLRTSSNREPDGRTYMGAVTLRIITQH